MQVPLIDLEPWYSYVLKTERPEVVESAASNTPSRASTTYEPEQKVTVSLLIEISKEIMSLYGKAKKGDASASPSFCIWLVCLRLLFWHTSCIVSTLVAKHPRLVLG